MSDIESKILERELGKLGGIGAKWAARLLPSVVFESTFELSTTPANARTVGLSVLTEIGFSDPELPELSVICGSGNLNLNPTIVSLVIVPLDRGCKVLVRGIAKEGLVKQDSARKAVERVSAILQKRVV